MAHHTFCWWQQKPFNWVLWPRECRGRLEMLNSDDAALESFSACVNYYVLSKEDDEVDFECCDSDESNYFFIYSGDLTDILFSRLTHHMVLVSILVTVNN